MNETLHAHVEKKGTANLIQKLGWLNKQFEHIKGEVFLVINCTV